MGRVLGACSPAANRLWTAIPALYTLAVFLSRACRRPRGNGEAMYTSSGEGVTRIRKSHSYPDHTKSSKDGRADGRTCHACYFQHFTPSLHKAYTGLTCPSKSYSIPLDLIFSFLPACFLSRFLLLLSCCSRVRGWRSAQGCFWGMFYGPELTLSCLSFSIRARGIARNFLFAPAHNSGWTWSGGIT